MIIQTRKWSNEQTNDMIKQQTKKWQKFQQIPKHFRKNHTQKTSKNDETIKQITKHIYRTD